MRVAVAAISVGVVGRRCATRDPPPCGTGTAWGGLDRLGLRGIETIAIFGQGPVGLSGTQLAAAMGARVIALDIDPGRLQRAKQFGAHDLVDAKPDNVVEAIRD